MDAVFSAFSAAGPYDDARATILACLALALMVAGVVLVCRMLGFNLGVTMIDYTAFGNGCALPLLGYVLGSMIGIVLRTLAQGEHG